MTQTTRPTSEIETPSGHRIVFYQYPLGSDMESIEDVFLAKYESTKDEDGKVRSFASGNPVRAAAHRAAELLVVSVDGSSDNVLEAIRGMKVADYDFAMAHVDKLAAREKKAD